MQTYLPHQQRVFDERTELDAKAVALHNFAKTQTFAELHLDEQELLLRQLKVMRQYLHILCERIAGFDEPVVSDSEECGTGPCCLGGTSDSGEEPYDSQNDPLATDPA